jgi:hypothetical protein
LSRTAKSSTTADGENGARSGLRQGDGGPRAIEYLAAENHLLKAQLKGRLKLSDHVARDHVMYVLLSLTCRAALPAQLEWRILAQARKDVRRRLVEPEAGRIR